ncbi:MAG: ATP-binding protein [Lachnospirales bacterium]
MERIIDLLYTKYLKAYISYEGVTRIEKYLFPKEAVRESVYKAIAHKNYDTLITIQISVYEDKLYIINYCIFPEDWTVKELLSKHRSRPFNPVIANTFFRVGFIEAWVRGIENINDSCIKAKIPTSEYVIKKEDFTIKFSALTNQANQDGNIYNRIIIVIKDTPEISQLKIANSLGETLTTVKYHMKRMREKGIITREGTSQKGRWVINE